MSSNKEKYSGLLDQEMSIPLFSRDWWLDAVCGPENWDVVLVEKGGQVAAAMPYYTQNKHGLRLITMPLLTQTMGPWISYPPGQKEHTRLSYEKEIMTALIDQLPKHDYFKQNFHYSVTNWLPFFWKGFSQLTRYTYIIEDMTDTENIFEGLRGNIKRQVKKAEKIVSCLDSDDIREFYELNLLTYKGKNKSAPVSFELLSKLDKALKSHNARKIFIAKDDSGAVHAGIYIVYDKQRVYYLMGGTNPENKNSGATSFLMWEAIKFAATFARVFDFEGSMLEPVENFFRSFGAVQKPYFRITRVNSKLLKLAFAAKELLK